MQFRFVHDFDVEPPQFWEMFFSEAFETELFRGLKMRSWRAPTYATKGPSFIGR